MSTRRTEQVTFTNIYLKAKAMNMNRSNHPCHCWILAAVAVLCGFGFLPALSAAPKDSPSDPPRKSEKNGAKQETGITVSASASSSASGQASGQGTTKSQAKASASVQVGSGQASGEKKSPEESAHESSKTRSSSTQSSTQQRSVSVTHNDRTVEISENTPGGIEVKITESVDGTKKTRVFKAKNEKVLRKKHPEAYELYKEHMSNAATSPPTELKKALQDFEAQKAKMQKELEAFQQQAEEKQREVLRGFGLEAMP